MRGGFYINQKTSAGKPADVIKYDLVVDELVFVAPAVKLTNFFADDL